MALILFPGSYTSIFYRKRIGGKAERDTSSRSIPSASSCGTSFARDWAAQLGKSFL